MATLDRHKINKSNVFFISVLIDLISIVLICKIYIIKTRWRNYMSLFLVDIVEDDVLIVGSALDIAGLDALAGSQSNRFLEIEFFRPSVLEKHKPVEIGD